MSNYLYENNGVVFRKLMKEDLNRLLCLKNESWSNTHKVTITNMDDQYKWYESLLKESVNYPNNLVLIAAIKLDKGGEPLTPTFGMYKILNINWVNRTANVGWDVFKVCRGKGYGKKMVAAGASFCFDVLNLRRLNAEILADNTASIKCAEAAGFTLEGTKMQEVHRCGKYIDSHVYGKLNI